MRFVNGDTYDGMFEEGKVGTARLLEALMRCAHRRPLGV